MSDTDQIREHAAKLEEFDRAIRVGRSCPVCADSPELVGKLQCPRCGKKPRPGGDIDGK